MDLGKRVVSTVLMAGLMAGGLFLSGCDDNVEILRDPDVRVAKGMTWAWRPLNAPEGAKREAGGKTVVSRDVIAPEGQPWLEAYAQSLEQAQHPTMLLAAE